MKEISLKRLRLENKTWMLLSAVCLVDNFTAYLHVQDGVHQSSLPVPPSLVQLYTCDEPVLPLSRSRSGLVSHSSVSEAGTCSLDDLSCVEPEASLLRLQTASFHSLKASYVEK